MIAPLRASAPPPRIAITHDYLTQYGGAERVLEAMHALWPGAPIYTTFYDQTRLKALGFRIPDSLIHPLVPSWLPHAGRIGKAWTFAYPLIWRNLDLSAYDLVISSTSFAAHHARVSMRAKHVCYCHSPARFLYGLTTEVDHARLRRALPFLNPSYKLMRRADRAAAARVTCFVANSREVQTRIRQFYGRESVVVNPPVNTAAFSGATVRPGEYFLSYGRLVGSKRVDMAIEAANLAHAPLVVAGVGPEERHLRRIAGSTVRFAGRPSDTELLELISRCKALVFTADEDFGMVPVEVNAAGKPVIALARGGALETIEGGVTGEFYSTQNPGALARVLQAFNGDRYAPERCRAKAATFDRAVFLDQLSRAVGATIESGHCI